MWDSAVKMWYFPAIVMLFNFAMATSQSMINFAMASSQSIVDRHRDGDEILDLVLAVVGPPDVAIHEFLTKGPPARVGDGVGHRLLRVLGVLGGEPRDPPAGPSDPWELPRVRYVPDARWDLCVNTLF